MNKLYAVFTKDSLVDSLTLHMCKYDPVTWWDTRTEKPAVKESSAVLPFATERIIKRMMKAGYKYVHFEYE